MNNLKEISDEQLDAFDDILMADMFGGGAGKEKAEGVKVPADLASMAAQIDGESAAPGQAGPVGPSAGHGLASELEGLGGLVALMCSKRWPWVPEVWGPVEIAQISQAAAAVCEKHGWLAGGIGGGAEMMLVLALAGPVVATVERVKNEKASGAAM
jgi:hypothetical protein